ncbi:MAG TPA: hypothetical protein DEB40_00215 [Elusimicrobia bacterium]|nr:hypothetical protein [Elusimicrobiota bacterium]HBT60157.1 hypothetical protein [Elusimicrobiota bacterium]
MTLSDDIRKKILVVDDNPAFLDLVDMVFANEFLVVRAANGREGLEAARRENPSLILLDVVMPEVSGLELLGELQAEARTRTIPVIVLTASRLDEASRRRVQTCANVAGLLSKPCGVETLRSRIRAVLEDGHEP